MSFEQPNLQFEKMREELIPLIYAKAERFQDRRATDEFVERLINAAEALERGEKMEWNPHAYRELSELMRLRGLNSKQITECETYFFTRVPDLATGLFPLSAEMKQAIADSYKREGNRLLDVKFRNLVIQYLLDAIGQLDDERARPEIKYKARLLRREKLPRDISIQARVALVCQSLGLQVDESAWLENEIFEKK
jgi:hypothetical protein